MTRVLSILTGRQRGDEAEHHGHVLRAVGPFAVQGVQYLGAGGQRQRARG